MRTKWKKLLKGMMDGKLYIRNRIQRRNRILRRVENKTKATDLTSGGRKLSGEDDFTKYISVFRLRQEYLLSTLQE